MAKPVRFEFDEWGPPAPRKLAAIVEILLRGAVIAYPTDSVFALGCAIDSKVGIETIFRARKMAKHRQMALICPDLSTASQFGQFSQTAFRLAQRIFPGPYTLVVPATRDVPRTLLEKRRTVGIRIPSHPVAVGIAKALGRPLLTSSAIDPDTHEVCSDLDAVAEVFGQYVEALVDAPGVGGEPSTVLEVSGEEIVLVRQGQGDTTGLFLAS